MNEDLKEYTIEGDVYKRWDKIRPARSISDAIGRAVHMVNLNGPMHLFIDKVDEVVFVANRTTLIIEILVEANAVVDSLYVVTHHAIKRWKERIGRPDMFGALKRSIKLGLSVKLKKHSCRADLYIDYVTNAVFIVNAWGLVITTLPRSYAESRMARRSQQTIDRWIRKKREQRRTLYRRKERFFKPFSLEESDYDTT